MISKRFIHRECVLCCSLATVSLHFFLPTTLPTFLWKPTKVRSPGAPGSFSTHSFCRSAVPQSTPCTTRLEPAQIDDNPPHSHLFSLIVPSPFVADSLEVHHAHSSCGRVRRHLIGFLHCFELFFRGELLSTLAAQKTVRKSDKMAPNSIR